MRNLDRTDRLILEILQQQARISISELAAKVNLSTTPCSDRVKRLEREGIITGYHARLNPNLVNKSLLVFLEIKLSTKSGDVFEQVSKNCQKFQRYWNVIWFRVSLIFGQSAAKRDEFLP